MIGAQSIELKRGDKELIVAVAGRVAWTPSLEDGCGCFSAPIPDFAGVIKIGSCEKFSKIVKLMLDHEDGILRR